MVWQIDCEKNASCQWLLLKMYFNLKSICWNYHILGNSVVEVFTGNGKKADCFTRGKKLHMCILWYTENKQEFVPLLYDNFHAYAVRVIQNQCPKRS